MRMVKITGLALFAILFAAIIDQTSVLYAQVSPGQSANVDDAQLKSFARVYVQIEKIRDTYAP